MYAGVPIFGKDAIFCMISLIGCVLYKNFVIVRYFLPEISRICVPLFYENKNVADSPTTMGPPLMSCVHTNFLAHISGGSFWNRLRSLIMTMIET